MEGLWDWQWTHDRAVLARAVGVRALRTRPDVVVCLELHPGTSIYNAESYRQLRAVTGDNVRVNLDPSHFWWQGIDPVTTVRELGDAVGVRPRQGHASSSPTASRCTACSTFAGPPTPTRCRGTSPPSARADRSRNGSDLLRALREAGYDDVVSIEHEDPNLDAEAGIEASLRGLQSALALLGVGSA